MKKSFIQFGLIIPLILVLYFIVHSQSQRDKADDVRAAVLGLYSALNAGDADAFVQYMGPGGYTEFSENGGPLFNIDEEYVRRAFASGLKADFEIQEIKVKVFEEAAVVTGYRLGRLIIPNQPTQKSRLCLSMTWFRQDGKWKLAHIHLSPSNH
jgi:ketosteroid isomerase-like protein